MRLRAAFGIALICAAASVRAEPPPLLDPREAASIAGEVSGSAAKRTVQALSLHHRMRGSQAYRAAVQVIRAQLEASGFEEIEMIALPADGRTFYGTQLARPAWDASFAELWEQKEESGRWTDSERVASWAHEPITLAQDSVSGSAAAELVDVGAGTSQSDYAGKDVRGKLVLTSSQPEAVAGIAVTQLGAAGIVSWAQNQKQAWWGEDESLVRWGHLNTWKDPTFAFMVSPARARAWQDRLLRGETVRLRAKVEAGRSAGHYLIPTAVIPGQDRSREIVYSCHLDHPSPGANDDASGCAGILEVARSLNRLVSEGRLPKPQRTLRFVWPCEVECSIALLNARPEFARRALATIHLDMIGGDTEKTKSVLRVHGSPPSLPSFVSDVGFALAHWVNDESLQLADVGVADWPLIEPDGDKRALGAIVGGFSEGSDHVVWTEGSWRVPVIYVSDWPDRYIHTNRDIPENLDSTKLKRAIFIAAASGWLLANASQADVPALQARMRAGMAYRRAQMLRRSARLSDVDAALLERHLARSEAAEARSLERFGLAWVGDPPPAPVPPAEGGAVYRRKADPKGPMHGFGYSWIDDRLERTGLPRPALLDRASRRDSASFHYETLNLVDGQRSVAAIREALFASIGEVPQAEVADYLSTLERLGLLERVR